jgi:hypothetical protein
MVRAITAGKKVNSVLYGAASLLHHLLTPLSITSIPPDKKSKRAPRQPKISQEMVNKRIKAHKFAQPHSLKKQLPPLKNTKSVESLGQLISKKVPLPGSTFQGSKGTGLLKSAFIYPCYICHRCYHHSLADVLTALYISPSYRIS